MRRSPLLLAVAALVAASPVCLAGSLPACPVTTGQTVSYDLIRSGAVIGHQTLRFTRNGADTIVAIDVSAALHALGVRVYHYEHHGEERWHDGQLVGLVSQTDDDGIARHVDVSRDASGTWHGIAGAQPKPGPLLSTSLWNNQILSQTRLLDRETGEIVPVHVSPAGQDVLQLGERQANAAKYDLAGLVKGTVWYDASGCWVQAVFHTRVDGSLIEMRGH